MKKRLTYEAPEAEMIIVGFEKNILSVDEGYAGVQDAGQRFNSPHTYRDDF